MCLPRGAIGAVGAQNGCAGVGTRLNLFCQVCKLNLEHLPWIFLINSHSHVMIIMRINALVDLYNCLYIAT